MNGRNTVTIIEAIEDQNLFGPLFRDQSTWFNWKVFLKALFGLEMDRNELEIYRKYTGRSKPPGERTQEAFAIVGRRGGKSFISAIIACYLALFYDWRPYLSPGEYGWIMVIASDREQARVILNYIKAILKLKIFKKQVEKELAWEIRLSNQIIIAIKTCDYRSIRGFTVVAAICDEVAFWRVEGASPAKEIITALRPALATVPGSLLLGISTPYSKFGVLYETFKKEYGRDDSNILIWKAPTRVMNPKISETTIERALKEDYTAAKAEWLAEFRDDLESYLSTEMIEAVIVPRWEIKPINGVQYYAFVDPSGGRGDSFTLAIAHRYNDKIILDRVEERMPPFRPMDVVKEFAEILEQYGVSLVVGDKYAGEWVATAFEEHGINYESSDLTRSEIYLEFEPLVAQRRVELLDIKKLFNQLRGLERRTRSGGKDKIDHYPGGHDDLANAVAGVCTLVARNFMSVGCGLINFSGDGEEDDFCTFSSGVWVDKKQPLWLKSLEKEIEEIFYPD